MTKANLQDIFLLRARREQVPVTMFLRCGASSRDLTLSWLFWNPTANSR